MQDEEGGIGPVDIGEGACGCCGIGCVKHGCALVVAESCSVHEHGLSGCGRMVALLDLLLETCADKC